MSVNELISLRGSKFFFAQSSQKGHPVSGLKCHWMISFKCALSWSCAALMAVGSTVMLMRVVIEPQRRRGPERTRISRWPRAPATKLFGLGFIQVDVHLRRL